MVETITSIEQFEDLAQNLLESIEFIESQGWTEKDAANLHKEHMDLEKAFTVFFNTKKDDWTLKIQAARPLRKIRTKLQAADQNLLKQLSKRIDESTAAMDKKRNEYAAKLITEI